MHKWCTVFCGCKCINTKRVNNYHCSKITEYPFLNNCKISCLHSIVCILLQVIQRIPVSTPNIAPNNCA